MILSFVKSVKDVTHIDYEHKYDRRMFLLKYENQRHLKVEFTKYPFPLLKSCMLIEGIKVDSRHDILANKLVAMTDRRDLKDYIDVYALLKEYPEFGLSEAIRSAEKKFGIQGIGYILQRKFLEDLPPPGVLPMLKSYQFATIAAFYKREAGELITRSLDTEV